MTMENFAQLLEESFTLQEMNPGEVITAEVVGIDQLRYCKRRSEIRISD